MSRRVAVVVGSGGLKCASALGLWKVLREEAIEISMLVGCSGGSIYASLIAQGWDIDKALRVNDELWPGVFRRLHYRSLVRAAFPRVFGSSERFGIIDDRRLNRAFRILFGDARLEDAAIPLHIVAADLRKGEKVVLSSGSAFDAVRASVSIPLILPPWPVDGRLLIDGGATDPLPVDVAMREGADVILAMGFENPILPDIASVARLILQASAIATNHLLKSTYAFYSMAHHAEVIPIMPAFDRRVGLRDTHLMPWIIEQGEIAARRELPYLRRLLNRDAVSA